jgi:hypothetical protein
MGWRMQAQVSLAVQAVWDGLRAGRSLLSGLASGGQIKRGAAEN